MFYAPITRTYFENANNGFIIRTNLFVSGIREGMAQGPEAVDNVNPALLQLAEVHRPPDIQ